MTKQDLMIVNYLLTQFLDDGPDLLIPPRDMMVLSVDGQSLTFDLPKIRDTARKVFRLLDEAAK